MGNHKGCPYGRLVGGYFVAMTEKSGIRGNVNTT